MMSGFDDPEHMMRVNRANWAARTPIHVRGRGAVERDSTFTYTDGPALSEARVSYEWMHGVGEVINALTGAGLRIERLREIERLRRRAA